MAWMKLFDATRPLLADGESLTVSHEEVSGREARVRVDHRWRSKGRLCSPGERGQGRPRAGRERGWSQVPSPADGPKCHRSALCLSLPRPPPR